MFTRLTAHAALLGADDVDTDQIIPARFLKVINKEGLTTGLFADWRYLPDGSPHPDFCLNRSETAGAEILVTGRNFGCGSSREHAPWALRGFGFRVVIALSFGDIFRANALKNGLLPVTLDQAAHTRLVEAFASQITLVVNVDLESQTVSWPGTVSVKFKVDPFARQCLLKGVDELGYLLSYESAITSYERRRTDQAGGEPR
ncbi:isopropylmalate isomerase [Hapalosiphon sp. MRB220]|nr:isopropylmalate isomerase [Hapalosiphon sp. MRB220]